MVRKALEGEGGSEDKDREAGLTHEAGAFQCGFVCMSMYQCVKARSMQWQKVPFLN